MAATSANTLATCSRVNVAPQQACRNVNMMRLFNGTPYMLVSESTCAVRQPTSASNEIDCGRLLHTVESQSTKISCVHVAARDAHCIELEGLGAQLHQC